MRKQDTGGGEDTGPVCDTENRDQPLGGELTEAGQGSAFQPSTWTWVCGGQAQIMDVGLRGQPGAILGSKVLQPLGRK